MNLGPVQSNPVNPYAVGQRPTAAPRESTGLGDDQHDVHPDGAAGASETAESQSQSGFIGIIRLARGKVVGVSTALATHPLTAEQAPQVLTDTLATVAEAEEAFSQISPDSPEYEEATRIMIELQLSAVGIARGAIDTLNGSNSDDVNISIATQAGNLILQASQFKEKVDPAYPDSTTLANLQTLDREASNAAYALVNKMEALGMEIDPLLAELANSSPDSAQADPGNGSVQGIGAIDLSEIDTPIDTLNDILDKIRDAYRQDAQEDNILSAKLAEKRMEEAKLLQKKMQKRIEELVAAISSVLNNPGLDPESARARLGALLAEVEAAQAKFGQIQDQLPVVVQQEIGAQLNSIHDQLIDALNGVGVAVLDQELTAANQELQERMASLGIDFSVA